MNCTCPSCRPPRWLSRRDWFLALDIALFLMLVYVLAWAWGSV